MRGYDYYQSGHVQNVTIRKNFIKATVLGSDIYDVEISLKNGVVNEIACDCPYAQDGNYCKHMVAVLYYVEEEGANNQKEPVNNDDTITKLVNEADVTLVREFLEDMLMSDENMLSRFKRHLNLAPTAEDIKQYKQQVTETFRRYSDSGQFINYSKAKHLHRELSDMIDNEIGRLLNTGHYEDAFKLTNHVFLKLAKQDMDDSAGEKTMLSYSCVSIWTEVLDNSDNKLKKVMLRWFLKHIENTAIDALSEHLEDFAFTHFKEKEFLDEKFIFAGEMIEKLQKPNNSWTNEYDIGRWIMRQADIMEEQQRLNAEIDLFLEEHLQYPKVRNYLVDRYMDNQYFDKAIKLLKEGIEVDNEYRGRVTKYEVKLKGIYKLTGDDKAYEEALWSLLIADPRNALDNFKELKAFYPEDEWEIQREIAFAKLELIPSASLSPLYLSEKLYDRLLKDVLESESIYSIQNYEKVLKTLYPQELLKQYERLIQIKAKLASSRSQYRDVVRDLKAMKVYPGGEKVVRQIIEDWQSIYNRRSAMIDELSKL